MHICDYCKYCNELCYKAPLCGMVVIWSCFHDVFLLSMSFIVNTPMRYVIKIHRKYVSFSILLLVIGVIGHREWCSPRGENYVTSF